MSSKKFLSQTPDDDHIPNTLSKADENVLSVYEIIKWNMSKARRSEFLFQIIYIGTFDESIGHMTIYKMISEDIELHKDGSACTVQGLMLMYNNCFINTITCTQDIMYRHLRNLLQSGIVFNMKVLHYHPHIIQNQFENWYMLYVPPKLAKESTLESKEQEYYNIEARGTPRTGYTKEQNDETNSQNISVKQNSSVEFSMSDVLNVFDEFNELCAYLQKKSSGYLEMSETERQAGEMSHLIPNSRQVLKACEHDCLQDVRELLVDYHQLRHTKFHTDDLWPLPTSYNTKSVISGSHNEEDDQSINESNQMQDN